MGEDKFKKILVAEVTENLANLISLRGEISEIKEKVLLLRKLGWDDNKIQKLVSDNVRVYQEIFDSLPITSPEQALANLTWLIAMGGSVRGIKKCIKYLIKEKYEISAIKEISLKAFLIQQEIFGSKAIMTLAIKQKGVIRFKITIRPV